MTAVLICPALIVRALLNEIMAVRNVRRAQKGGERKVKTQRLGGRLPPFMASAKGIVGRILTAAL